MKRLNGRLKKLEQLQRQHVVEQLIDAKKLLLERLNRMAERDPQPERPPLTPEELAAIRDAIVLRYKDM